MQQAPVKKQLPKGTMDYKIQSNSREIRTDKDQSQFKRVNDRNNHKAINPGQEQDIQIAENFQKIEKKKTTQDVEFISNGLKDHFIFYRLSETERKKLSTVFFYCALQKGDNLITQGQDATTFFILEQGTIEVLVNNEPKRQLKSGQGFGELALLYNSKRTASCRALENCSLWGIDRKKFKFIVNDMSSKEIKQNLEVIEKIQLFQNLTKIQREKIASAMIEQKFNQDQDIINENDPASSFYIIKQGIVSVLKDGAEVKTLSTGTSFGETALLSGEQVRTMTIRAKELTVCLGLGRDMLTQILGNKVQEIIFRNLGKWTLEKLSYGKQLESTQIEHLLDHVTYEDKHGQLLMKKGTPLREQIILVLQGEVYYKSNNQKIGEKFSRIGEMEVLERSAQAAQDDIMGSKDCKIGILTNNDIVKELGADLKTIVNRNIQVRNQRAKQEQEMQSIVQKLQLKDIKVLKHLGAGQFGNVYLVKYPGNNQLWALKCINKKQVCEQHLEKYVVEEKTILAEMNFPFIMRFYRSLQDDYHVFFLLEFIQGMELFDVIREIGLLSTFDCQFYTGSIILAIEYMHKNNIVYRDIKPENIMVTNQGYPKLVDMGTAHKFKDGENRTSTIIGTPHYMAPELLSGKGYSYYVDLWSTGICLYEFMCGYVPFGEDAEDPYEIYELIIKEKHLKYPQYVKDSSAKLLMEQLLSKTPEIRQGGSYSKLKRHKWFSDFSWDQLLEQVTKAPWAPPKEKRIDTISLIQQENSKPMLYKLKDIANCHKEPVSKSKKFPDWDKIF